MFASSFLSVSIYILLLQTSIVKEAIQQDSINAHDAECAALMFGERMKERLGDLEEKLRILKSCLVESHKSNYQLKISKEIIKIMGIIESNYGDLFRPNEEHATMYKKLHRIYRAHGSNQYRHEQCYYHFPSKHRMDVEKLSELIREMYAAKSQFVRDSLIQKAYERMAFYLQGSSGKLHFVSDSNPFQF
ncbi:unnamed protein product [Heterobilharzia americana]|nr:unnamed protein product [Heterobilharzia americana]